MSFFTTSDFRRNLNQFTKRSSDGYSNCVKDIKSFFTQENIQLLLENETILNETNGVFLQKIRIKNSNNNFGKSSGYRVIILRKMDIVTFLHVYPKIGKYKQTTVREVDLKILLRHYFEEFTKKELVEIDFNKL